MFNERNLGPLSLPGHSGHRWTLQEALAEVLVREEGGPDSVVAEELR